MSMKYIELRPNIDLIDADFNGYKLSLEEIPITRQKLSNYVDRVSPNNEQYSLLHARLFVLHNHLINDHWNDAGSSLYYIDTNRCVQKILDENLKSVWEIPVYKKRKEGDFNFSIYFPSTHLAVVSDGAGTLTIVDTGNRENCDHWCSLFSDIILGEEKPFIILHAQYSELKVLDCVLLSIEFNNDLKHFENVIDWITLIENDDKTWKIDASRQLKGKGELHYCALEKGAKAIYIGSEFQFKFVKDSKNPIVEKKVQDKKVYLWKQSAKDIEVILNTGQKVDKSEVSVVCEQDKNLIVSFKDKVILDIKLWLDVKVGLIKWSIDGNDKLSIVLQKSQLGFFWSDLAEGGDKYGEQIVDPEESERVHERLAHLCSESQVAFEGSGPTFSVQQLEECDLATEEMAVLDRISSETHDPTHRVNLGSNQVLFTLHHTDPPTLTLRHDVDGCIWQPELNKDTNDWNMKHLGTLSAFGYIQASKEQKKFSTCASNLGYSVICEANRHVFVYRQLKRVRDGCELRNRVKGVSIEEFAQQQVVTMRGGSDVLGVYAAVDCLYVLTKDEILRLQIL